MRIHPGWPFAAILLTALSGYAQNRPLRAPDADIVPAGAIRTQVGIDFLQRIDYPLSGLSGDQTNVGVLDLRVGVAETVEIQLSGTLRQFLQIKAIGPSAVPLALPSADSTDDIGDFSVLTKLLLFSERGHRPALASRFGFTMPNTNQARGIGNNAANISSEFVLQKTLRGATAFGSIGLAMLSAPNQPGAQNDVLLYGLGFRAPLSNRLSLVAEAAGRHSWRTIDMALLGTESRGQARAGIRILAGGVQWDAAGIAGIYRNDPRSGFTFGVSHDFQLFGRRP
jgi:hypothetical protein